MQAAAGRAAKGSFVPSREQRELRDLTRYRRKLVQQESAEHNRMIRIFEDANLKLSSVFSNIRGKTCTMVIDAVIAGETNPQKLASLCTHWRLKSTREEIALAVEGKFTEHHKFMIRAIRTSIMNIEKEIAHLDQEIERRVQPFAEQISRLSEIPGIDAISAKELLAEIGVDLEVFPTAEHLASWAGLAPGNNESAGKKSSHQPRKQGHQGYNDGMRMVRHQDKRHLFLSHVQEAGRKAREEASLGGSCSRNAESCLPHAKGRHPIQGIRRQLPGRVAQGCPNQVPPRTA